MESALSEMTRFDFVKKKQYGSDYLYDIYEIRNFIVNPPLIRFFVLLAYLTPPPSVISLEDPVPEWPLHNIIVSTAYWKSCLNLMVNGESMICLQATHANHLFSLLKSPHDSHMGWMSKV